MSDCRGSPHSRFAVGFPHSRFASRQRHTFKSQFVVLPKGKEIVDVVVGKPGLISDIKICRQTLNRFDEHQVFSGDKAYVGESQITTPSKKPKNGELTDSQKADNKLLSKSRIFV